MKDLSIAAWVLLAALSVLAIQYSGQDATERDFIYFYSLGRILNEHPPGQLFDLELQQRTFNEVQRSRRGDYGPSPYPPFVALLFAPFARLPFMAAYRIWMVLSLILYCSGLRLLAHTFLPRDRNSQSLIFALSLSYWPFIARTLLTGQVAAIGFFGMSWAICEEHRGRRLLSGAALSLCCYKPTLLLLVVPMLIVCGRFQTFAGFLCGATAWFALATLRMGVAIWDGYWRMAVYFARFHSRLFLWDYVDLRSFSSAVVAAGIRYAPPFVVIAAAAAIVVLVSVWWRQGRGAAPHAFTRIWAVTLTWTLLLNLYVPVYDTILAIVGIIVTAKPFCKSGNRMFGLACGLLWGVPLAAPLLGRGAGGQAMTVVLAALGTLQLRQLARTDEY